MIGIPNDLAILDRVIKIMIHSFGLRPGECLPARELTSLCKNFAGPRGYAPWRQEEIMAAVNEAAERGVPGAYYNSIALLRKHDDGSIELTDYAFRKGGAYN
jgi:hypothetical protein